MTFRDELVLDDLEQRLYDELAAMTIIDAHEHYKPEKDHLKNTYDWAWLLRGYLLHDLVSAGLRADFEPFDNSLTPARKWDEVKPYWDAVRWGTYARGLRFTLKEWFGVEDITDDTFERVGEKLNEDNTPGVYERALAEKCSIERVIISNTEWHGYEIDLFRIIVGFPYVATSEDVAYYEKLTGESIRTAAEFRKGIEKFIADALEAGVVGFKASARPAGECDDAGIDRLLAKISAGGNLSAGDRPAMDRFIHEESLGHIRGTDKVVAVHCGVWGDFRALDVMNIFQTLARYRDVRFDLFHMGMPSVRQMAFVGKNLPNVSLNLCWSPLVSQHMMESALQEWLDLVPVNKVFGFGGDFIWNPEQTWGHLVMCRESLAKVFAARIRRGMIDLDGAVEVLETWMYDNPKRYYRL